MKEFRTAEIANEIDTSDYKIEYERLCRCSKIKR